MDDNMTYDDATRRVDEYWAPIIARQRAIQGDRVMALIVDVASIDASGVDVDEWERDIERTRRCARCGEQMNVDACEGAEIVDTTGQVLFVHADSCMRDSDTIA